jgi:predicted dehydrogenase
VTVDRLRIGTLGAARVTPGALIKPARQIPEVTVAAVAARDPERARRFAAKHRIRRVHDSYQELIDDPAIDAVYNPLPNSLHARWTLRAIEAGKHVLCEKPFTANAAEAAEVAAAAAATGLVVMEAFHYRYHPLARRMREVVGSGEIGALRYLEASLCFPLPRFSDIRYSYDLAGGATMDAGCYAINWLRMIGPGEPEVLSARARLHGPDVDRAMAASFRFAGGVLGRMTASLWSGQLLRLDAKAVGDRGVMRVFNYVSPQTYNRLTVTADGYTRRERVSGEPSYTYQLRAFAAAVRHGDPVLTTAEDAVGNMTVIDAVYQAAGLPRRGA